MNTAEKVLDISSRYDMRADAAHAICIRFYCGVYIDTWTFEDGSKLNREYTTDNKYVWRAEK